MGLTPAEIRHVSIQRGLFGYRRAPTDRLLDEIAESFEDVWRDRGDLGERVEHLEEELVRYRELEALLRTTLVSAERAAGDLREQAQREADLIVSEAHAEARGITRRARAEREELARDFSRIRALLASALATLEAVPDGGHEAADGAPAEAA